MQSKLFDRKSVALTGLLLILLALAACADRSDREVPDGYEYETAHPALRLALNSHPEMLARAGSIPPAGRDIEVYNWLRTALSDASTRAAAAETLLTRWSNDPTNFLWIETAWIRASYLADRWAECSELFARAVEFGPVFEDFVYARMNWGRAEDAPDAFRRALAESDSLDGLQGLWLKMRVARMDADAGNLDQAITDLATQVEIAWDVGGSPAAFLIWHETANLLRRGDRLTEALLASRSALECATETENPILVLRERVFLGGIHEEAREYLAARDTFEACLREARELGQMRYERDTLGRLAVVAGKQGDILREHGLDRQAADLSLVSGDTLIAIQSLIAAATAARRTDQIELSFLELAEAESLDQQWGVRDLSTQIQQDRAMLLNQIGRYAEAESIRTMLVRDYDPIADRFREFELQISLIRQGLETGRPHLYYQALERARELNPAALQRTPEFDPPMEFDVAAARVAAREGDLRLAEKHLELAEQRRELLGAAEWWQVVRTRAHLADLAGDPVSAIEHYAECLRIAQEYSLADLIKRSRVFYGLCLLDAGRFVEAEQAALQNRDAPQKWTRLNAWLLTGMALAGQERHREALLAFEGARSQVEGLVPDEYRWRLIYERSRSNAALGDRQTAFAGYQSVYENLPREIHLVADEAVRAYNQNLRAEVAEAMIGMLADDAGLVRENAAELTSEVAAWGRGLAHVPWVADRPEIRYFLGRENAYAWWSEDGELSWRKLASAERINSLARATYADLSYPGREVDHSTIQDLAQCLLGPVADLPTHKTLTIVPDGYLFNLPWAALPVADDMTLVERGPLVIRPPFDRGTRGRRDSPNVNRLLAIGFDGIESETETGPVLREAEAEARRIAELWSPAPVDLLTGTEAGKIDLLHRDLSGYRALHLATHTTVSSGRDGLSAIRMAGQAGAEPWTLAQVGSLDLAAELVYLSSCEGARQGAAGTSSFAGAFLAAGAGSVLASTRLVEDAAGRELAERFYRHWLEGTSRAAALRAAQLEMQSEIPEFAHPFYWSFFQLYE